MDAIGTCKKEMEEEERGRGHYGLYENTICCCHPAAESKAISHVEHGVFQRVAEL
jgi:hypothetical protein